VSEELIVAGEPWRVGVMFSQTGVTAAVERTALHGAVLAIEEINARGGVLDRLIEPVITDPESIPARYRSIAERLMTSERVRLIFGCYMSNSRKMTIPAVEAFRGLPHFPCSIGEWKGNIRARSSSGPARPYIARLRVFRRLICPSVWPLLHPSVSAFVTASRSRRTVRTKRCMA
jgi:hypothetical protein